MDTFLTVIGCIMVVFGGFFLIYWLVSIGKATRQYASFTTEQQKASFRRAIRGMVVLIVISATMLGFGLWLAVFRCG